MRFWNRPALVRWPSGSEFDLRGGCLAILRVGDVSWAVTDRPKESVFKVFGRASPVFCLFLRSSRKGSSSLAVLSSSSVSKEAKNLSFEVKEGAMAKHDGIHHPEENR